MTRQDLSKEEYDVYYAQYLKKLPLDIALLSGFKTEKDRMLDFFTSIPDEKLLFIYAPGKWNIKEILQHLIDTERIFMYRCFRIARLDPTPLAGFDQNIYNRPSGAIDKKMSLLLDEFDTSRSAFISLLESLKDCHLQNIGNANNAPISARALAFIVLGHARWHMEIIQEKYL